MDWKGAVGVPVHSWFEAVVRIEWKAEVMAGERAPCTKLQSRQPIQSAK